MHSALKPVKEILQVNTFMYGLSFEGIDETLAGRQLQPNANSLVWMLGHVASAKFYLASLIGLEEKQPWGNLFDTSITKIDQSKIPSLSEIKQVWEGISRKVMERLSQLDDARLNAPLPGRFPTEEQTILAGLAFLAMHEAYHIGQISHQRRLLGIDSLFDLAIRKKTSQ